MCARQSRRVPQDVRWSHLKGKPVIQTGARSHLLTCQSVFRFHPSCSFSQILIQLTKLKEQGEQQQENGGLVAELESHISDVDEQLNLSQLQVEELQHQLSQVSADIDIYFI